MKESSLFNGLPGCVCRCQCQWVCFICVFCVCEGIRFNWQRNTNVLTWCHLWFLTLCVFTFSGCSHAVVVNPLPILVFTLRCELHTDTLIRHTDTHTQVYTHTISPLLTVCTWQNPCVRYISTHLIPYLPSGSSFCRLSFFSPLIALFFLYPLPSSPIVLSQLSCSPRFINSFSVSTLTFPLPLLMCMWVISFISSNLSVNMSHSRSSTTSSLCCIVPRGLLGQRIETCGGVCMLLVTGGREFLSVKEFFTACSGDWIFGDFGWLCVCVCWRYPIKWIGPRWIGELVGRCYFGWRIAVRLGGLSHLHLTISLLYSLKRSAPSNDNWGPIRHHNGRLMIKIWV